MVETLAGSYGEGLPFSRESELAVLASRLEKGWSIIEERKHSGQHVEEYESHWLKLLAEYEAAYAAIHHNGLST